MNDEEIKEVLEELNEVRPEVLNNKAKRLFKAIMKIADDRDKANKRVDELINEVTIKQCELEKKDKIIDLMAEEYSLKTDTDVLDICACCNHCNEDCHGDYCKEALIEYFTKKADEK